MSVRTWLPAAGLAVVLVLAGCGSDDGAGSDTLSGGDSSTSASDGASVDACELIAKTTIGDVWPAIEWTTEAPTAGAVSQCGFNSTLSNRAVPMMSLSIYPDSGALAGVESIYDPVSGLGDEAWYKELEAIGVVRTIFVRSGDVTFSFIVNGPNADKDSVVADARAIIDAL